jgi:hypothetical protein
MPSLRQPSKGEPTGGQATASHGQPPAQIAGAAIAEPDRDSLASRRHPISAMRASADLLRLRQRYAELGDLCAAIRSRGGAFDDLDI